MTSGQDYDTGAAVKLPSGAQLASEEDPLVLEELSTRGHRACYNGVIVTRYVQ